MATVAINASDITKIGIGATVLVVVIGVVLGLVLTALVARLIIAVIVVVLAIFVWQQRGSIEHKIDQKACPPNLSFFGYHLDAPDSLTHFCREHGGHPRRHHHHRTHRHRRPAHG